MNYKELSRVIDSVKVQDSGNELYFFYDGFDGTLEENLTFDDLVELIKSQLSPDGEIYEEVEKNPEYIWDIEWDLVGGDFEQIHYGPMKDVDQYKETDEEEESAKEDGPHRLYNKFKEEVSLMSKELGDLIKPYSNKGALISERDLEKLNIPNWRTILREAGWKINLGLGIASDVIKDFVRCWFYD